MRLKTLLPLLVGSTLLIGVFFSVQAQETDRIYLPVVVGSGAIVTPPTPTPTPTDIPTLTPTTTPAPSVAHPSPGTCLTSEEASLAQQLNDYRAANGLATIPLSKSLTTVAQWHVIDLILHNPHSGTDPRGLPCNSHSWSDQGYWSSVCYTADHAYASGMWDKPDEITLGIYDSAGFEIAAWSHGDSISASRALSAWQKSPPHNAVILEQGVWQGYGWPAMGVGIYQRYAVVWFGRSEDPQGTISQCP